MAMMTSTQEKNFSVRNAQFTADVYNQLLTANSGSFSFCPTTAEVILAILHSGSQGKTAQEISTVLHFPDNIQEIRTTIETLAAHFQNNKNCALKSANKLYLKLGHNINDEFQKTVRNVFNADVENANFENPEDVATEINKWVGRRTGSTIKKIITKDQIFKFTRLLVISAACFSGRWEKAFGDYLTSKCPFYLDDNDKIGIDTMRQKDFFRYYDSSDLDASFLEMTYDGDEDITINFVLPNSREGLSKLEARLPDVFSVPEYSYYDVLVVMPKFEIETTIELKPLLQALGVRDAFEDTADFTGMVSDEPPKITTAIQKTFITIDERGTTPPAPTDCILELPEDCCIIEPKPQPAEFIADHPFLFYVKYKDVVLFVGRFTSTKS